MKDPYLTDYVKENVRKDTEKWLSQAQKRTSDPYKQYSIVKRKASNEYKTVAPFGSPVGNTAHYSWEYSTDYARKMIKKSSGKLIDFDIIK